MTRSRFRRLVSTDRSRSVRRSLSKLARLRSADGATPSGRSEEGDRRPFDVRETARNAGLAEGDPCDDLIRTVVDRAQDGDVIRFRYDRFALTDLHVIRKSLTIEGREATIEFGESGGLHFRGSHYNGADPTTTVRTAGSVPRGERAVEVERTEGFEPGDYVLLETGYAGWSSRHPLRTGSGYGCQVARLEEITADRFVLDRETKAAFDAVAEDAEPVEIHRLEPLTGPVFRGLSTVGGAIPLRLESCVGGRFEDCETVRYREYGQRVDYCLETVYEGAVVTGARDDGRREVVHVAHSTETTVDRPAVRRCRLGIGLSSGCLGVEIVEPSISGASVHAIATHDGTTAGGIRIDGGVIESESHDGASRDGSDLWFSNASGSASIHGTTVRTNRTAISANTGELVATDLVLESVDGPDGASGDRPVAVRFGGDEACVSGVLVDESGLFRSVSDLRGAGRATVELTRAPRPPARRRTGLVSAGLGYLSRAVSEP
jgi:hypothetical protein